MTRARRARGLTLLELLVATAVLAVFFAGVYGLVAAFVDTRNRIEEKATPYAVGPVVMKRVTDDLRAALLEPYKDLDAMRAEAENAQGEPCTKMDFVTVVPSRARVKVGREWQRAHVNEVGYRLRRSETAAGLSALYRREDLGVDDDPLGGGRYHKLCDRVKTFRVDFFAEDPGDPSADEAKGEEEWDAKKEKKLPYACRVTLTLLGEEVVDSDDRVLEDAPEYTFVSYVTFASRFDRPEQQQQPGR